MINRSVLVDRVQEAQSTDDVERLRALVRELADTCERLYVVARFNDLTGEFDSVMREIKEVVLGAA